jgi:hypothetical protein
MPSNKTYTFGPYPEVSTKKAREMLIEAKVLCFGMALILTPSNRPVAWRTWGNRFKPANV